jgi:hypothetical protein
MRFYQWTCALCLWRRQNPLFRESVSLCWEVPSLDPLVLFRQNVVENINVEQWWNGSEGGESESSERNPPPPLAILQPQITVKFPVRSHEDSDGGWNVGLPPLLRHSAQLGMQELSALRSGRSYPQGSSLLLISVRRRFDPVTTECGWRKRSLEHFQGLYRESNPDPL